MMALGEEMDRKDADKLSSLLMVVKKQMGDNFRTKM